MADFQIKKSKTNDSLKTRSINKPGVLAEMNGIVTISIQDAIYLEFFYFGLTVLQILP